MSFEKTVEKWCMDIISFYEDEVLLERDKLIKILNDMKTRKILKRVLQSLKKLFGDMD